MAFFRSSSSVLKHASRIGSSSYRPLSFSTSSSSSACSNVAGRDEAVTLFHQLHKEMENKHQWHVDRLVEIKRELNDVTVRCSHLEDTVRLTGEMQKEKKPTVFSLWDVLVCCVPTVPLLAAIYYI
jgi:hypothetical protein